MKSLLIILASLALSWFLIDISSTSSFKNLLMPFVFCISLIALLLKIVMYRHNRSTSSARTSSIDQSIYFGGSGGSGGSDNDECDF